MSLMTVRQMAHIIADSASDEESVFERIRHWTRERLLVPAHGQHPGTGNKRLYDQSVLQKAIVLNRLTEFGVSIKTLQFVILSLDSPVFERHKELHGDDVFLVIEKLLGEEERKLSWWNRKDPTGYQVDMNAEAVLLIKLG
jgi:hypothetical protein